MAPPTEVLAGVVRRPVGLRGEMLVHPDVALSDDFPPGATYRVAAPVDAHPTGAPPLPVVLEVAESALRSGRRVVRFAGYDRREDVEPLYGALLLRAAAEGELHPDEHWSGDVVGRPVLAPSGALLGTVVAVADGPAHDYLIVEAAGEEVWVPSVAELVQLTDDAVVVDAPPGLFDPGLAEPG